MADRLYKVGLGPHAAGPVTLTCHVLACSPAKAGQIAKVMQQRPDLVVVEMEDVTQEPDPCRIGGSRWGIGGWRWPARW